MNQIKLAVGIIATSICCMGNEMPVKPISFTNESVTVANKLHTISHHNAVDMHNVYTTR